MSPTGPIPIRLIIDGDNETVFTGSIRIFPGGSGVVDASGNIPDNVKGNITTSSGEEEEPYDHYGAMLFIVLVIAVYAISIVMLIASFIKKKQVLVSAEETKNVNQYLIAVSDLKEKTARENFKKLKRSIIEVVERSDSRRLSNPNGNAQEVNNKKRGDNKAFKHAILGAGISLYSPLIVIKEEEEKGDEASGSRRVVKVDVERPPRLLGPPEEPVPGPSHHRSPSPRGDPSRDPSSRFLLPPSGSVTPESPNMGSDHKTLLNSPSTSSASPTSPGTDSRRLLLDPDPDSPYSSSPIELSDPPEPVWQTRDDVSQGYKNASFLPSPTPRMPHQPRPSHTYQPPQPNQPPQPPPYHQTQQSRSRRGLFDDPSLPQSRHGLLSDIWVPLGHASSRTPSPSRRSGSSQDNAVSSV